MTNSSRMTHRSVHCACGPAGYSDRHSNSLAGSCCRRVLTTLVSIAMLFSGIAVHKAWGDNLLSPMRAIPANQPSDMDRAPDALYLTASAPSNMVMYDGHARTRASIDAMSTIPAPRPLPLGSSANIPSGLTMNRFEGPLPGSSAEVPVTTTAWPFRFFEGGAAGVAQCPSPGFCPTESVAGWHLLPRRVLFPSYLAGVHEPRIGAQWFDETSSPAGAWDSQLGGRGALVRYGTEAGYLSEGFELMVEGAAFPRMDLRDQYDRDVTANDYRVGGGLTWRFGNWEGKFAYFHLCAHLGDEYILAGRPQPRLNYIRDSFTLAVGYWIQNQIRLYAEAGYAFITDDGAEPWEFQFGIDWCTAKPTGFWGAPFLAFNGHITQEQDFSGHFVAEAGWAWRGFDGSLVRTGFYYLNGKSNMYEFRWAHEEQIGGGIWYDF